MNTTYTVQATVPTYTGEIPTDSRAAKDFQDVQKTALQTLQIKVRAAVNDYNRVSQANLETAQRTNSLVERTVWLVSWSDYDESGSGMGGGSWSRGEEGFTDYVDAVNCQRRHSGSNISEEVALQGVDGVYYKTLINEKGLQLRPRRLQLSQEDQQRIAKGIELNNAMLRVAQLQAELQLSPRK